MPEGTEIEEYISSAEAIKLFQQAGLSEGTFYDRVRKGEIRKHLPSQKKRGALYHKEDIAKSLRLRNGNRKSNNLTEEQPKISVPSLFDPGEVPNEFAIALLDRNDTPFLYTMESEVLGGIEHALSPISLQNWSSVNPHIGQILYNPSNRHEVWGMFVALPLEEELIMRVLHGETSINAVQPQSVLPYNGGEYSCYIAAFSIRPERQKYASNLMQAMVTHWQTLASACIIAKLYTQVSSYDGSSLHRLVREWYFSRRRDIAPQAWDLDLKADWQFVPSLAKYQKEAQMVTVLARRAAKKAMPATQLIPVTTLQDLRSTVDVGNSWYAYNRPLDEIVAVRKIWLESGPDTVYVLKRGEEVVGYHAMLALPIETIEAILRGERGPASIRAEEIRPFQPGSDLDVYIIFTGVRNGISGREKGAYASSLIRGLVHLFERLGKRGVAIRSIYGRSRTLDSIKLMQDLGFTELPYSPADDKRLFCLDVKSSKSEFIVLYKKELQKYQEMH